MVAPYTEYQECPHHFSEVFGGIAVLGGGENTSITPPRQRLSWLTARSKSDARSGKDARYASGRMRITTSAARSRGRSRMRESSRRRRLTRFLATAVWRRRGTIRPTLVCRAAECARGEAIARTSRKRVRMRFPSRATRCSSAPRVMRARRGKPCDALGASGSCVLVRDTDGELLPSLLAAASKCLTTPLGLHTRTEPVRLEPSRVSRTVGRLPHDCSLRTFKAKLRHRRVNLSSVER